MYLSRREKFFVQNNLLCLVKALENRYTTIDLRNEISITGKIEEVDGYMNIMLSNAAVFDSDENCRYFSMLHIQSRNIRNVHVPNNLSITKTIKDQLLKGQKKTHTKKKPTFKEIRAKRQQKDTVELIKKKTLDKEKQKDKESSSVN